LRADRYRSNIDVAVCRISSDASFGLRLSFLGDSILE